MEEILGILGFSLGASIGTGAVRSVAGGSRPVLREAFKTGIRAWDMLAGASASARAGLTSVRDDARTDRKATPSRTRSTAPRKIVIARD